MPSLIRNNYRALLSGVHDSAGCISRFEIVMSYAVYDISHRMEISAEAAFIYEYRTSSHIICGVFG